MKGKVVLIKLKGDPETAKEPMQRHLYRRADESETLFTPDGTPAGRLWMVDLDSLVGTTRYLAAGFSHVGMLAYVPVAFESGRHVASCMKLSLQISKGYAHRAAIRVLDKGADEAHSVVPDKMPNGLTVSLFSVGSIIEVSPFFGEFLSML